MRSLDAAKIAHVGDNGEMPYDLFLGVPAHRPPGVVQESGLCVDGWIPVDYTLQTSFPGVYAIGDVTSVGTPKAGVFAEGQAAIAAERIIASMRGDTPTAHYDGNGVCYLEFGHDEVARVDVTFPSSGAPHGTFEQPSREIARDKVAFGAGRVQRWFGRDWTP